MRGTRGCACQAVGQRCRGLPQQAAVAAQPPAFWQPHASTSVAPIVRGLKRRSEASLPCVQSTLFMARPMPRGPGRHVAARAQREGEGDASEEQEAAASAAAQGVANEAAARKGDASATTDEATAEAVAAREARPVEQHNTTAAADAEGGGEGGDEAAPSSSDLLIVGAGVLGACAGRAWRDTFPDAIVTGLTNGSANHNRLMVLGIMPATRGRAPKQKSPSVLFCAPPSGSEDYVGEVEWALRHWDGTGSFVFTSSSSVFLTPNSGTVTEDSALVPVGASPGTDKLLKAEHLVLQAGGNVLRLAGLYHRNRGAHKFFLAKKQVARWSGHTINLIHYEDAAELAVAIMSSGKKFSGMVFVGCDSNPITLQEMMNACLESRIFEGKVNFTGVKTTAPPKRIKNPNTNKVIGWSPKYRSFKKFFEAGAEDFYVAREFF